MNIRTIDNPDYSQWEVLSKRPGIDTEGLMNLVSETFDQVREDGDAALRTFTKKFDGVDLEDLELSDNLLREAAEKISPELKKAILTAKQNIEKFHQSQLLEIKEIETTPGVTCWQESRGIESVGLYVPGGSAPLFSTVLMLAIPAKIAACSEIILCTPPRDNGLIHPAIAYAAEISGVSRIFTIGGAQAIAAMSIGTEFVPKVLKIFGPGNQYVTAAKQYALNLGTAIDMPAGPSELLVITSENSNPSYVAADLLSQAEHGHDSQVICLSNTKGQLEEIIAELKVQIERLPRVAIAKSAMLNSKFIHFNNQEDLIRFSNFYAPEHLIIADDHFEYYISKIQNAGSVFLGNYCPESAGDYASGTNHTLPTSGFAKVYSGLNLDAFSKKVTFQKITKQGIQELGPVIEVMADAEGLEAHKNAVTIRLNNL